MALVLMLSGPFVYATPSTLEVSVSECGKNSFRVRIEPATRSPSVAATAQKLQRRLAAEGLTELPGAYLHDCGGHLGEQLTISPGAPPVINGNLRLTRSTSGTLSFSASDSGAPLFAATASFSDPTLANSCSSGALTAGNDLHVANMSLVAALAFCEMNSSCTGFTTSAKQSVGGMICGEETNSTQIHHFYFKRAGAGGSGDAAWRTWLKPPGGYLRAELTLKAGNTDERIYGLGQGNWTAGSGCPAGDQRIVPLARNGQRVQLRQKKFHVSIPFVYSSGVRQDSNPVCLSHVQFFPG